ncbi:SRR1-like protein [Sardina pilchardus]|uniref:SRR1-like protein n=1 Tax=Sardina pilchardus TaxID=27697 RepID=UPI002E123E50
MASDNEWQVAGRRKGSSSRKKKTPTVCAVDLPVPEAGDSHRDQQRIIQAVNELRGEDFWSEWKDLLTGRLSNTGPCRGQTGVQSERLQDCVCYGLGSFSTCVSARYQLALLLLLLDALKIPVERCSVYDPVFSLTECETLRALGFSVLTENEEGKRVVHQPTLLYLMHCGKALYNNLLWKNWSSQALPKLLIVGNSFIGIQERMLQRELQRDYAYLCTAMSVCEETALPCSQRFLDVFNDTALICFTPQSLSQLPESTWADPEEPQYQHCPDLEIIRRERR